MPSESLPEGTRRCRKCGEVKPLKEMTRHKEGRDGVTNECNICRREKARRRMEEIRRLTPERHRDQVRKHRQRQSPEQRRRQDQKDKLKAYGLTISDFAWMDLQQDGKCAICKGTNEFPRRMRLTVDHDHETGKVRGLLCNNCNLAIGNFRENPELLLEAHRYLVQKCGRPPAKAVVAAKKIGAILDRIEALVS